MTAFWLISCSGDDENSNNKNNSNINNNSTNTAQNQTVNNININTNSNSNTNTNTNTVSNTGTNIVTNTQTNSTENSNNVNIPAWCSFTCSLSDTKVDIVSSVSSITDYSLLAGKQCNTEAVCTDSEPELYIPQSINTEGLMDGRECLLRNVPDTVISRLESMILSKAIEKLNENMQADSKVLIAVHNSGAWRHKKIVEEEIFCSTGYGEESDLSFLRQGWFYNNSYLIYKMKVADVLQIFERQVNDDHSNAGGDWLIVGADQGKIRLVFDMTDNEDSQLLNPDTNEITEQGTRIKELVIGDKKFTDENCEEEIWVMSADFVAETLGTHQYAFQCALEKKELKISDIGLEGEEPLTQDHLVKNFITSIENKCLTGDMIINHGYDLGFTSEVDLDYCTE